MGRKALHTKEEVFQAADHLVSRGQEVTPTTLLKALGGGSLTTIYKHFDAWTALRATQEAPVIIPMPDSVKATLDQCWQVAVTEAGKEIAAIREKADEEVKLAQRRRDEAVTAIAQLETEQETDASRIDSLESELKVARNAAHLAATEAAAREAALSATVAELRAQIDTLKGELKLAHVSIDRTRTELSEANERERVQIKEITNLKSDVTKMTEQLKDQKMRSAEVINKLENSKQKVEAELLDSKNDAKALSTKLNKAVGELDALRTQVTSQNEVIKRFAPDQGL